MAATTLGETSSASLLRPAEIEAAASGLRNSTMVRLLRFALANIRRRPERFVLAVFGIALAILSVTVVRTISSSFAITGSDSVGRVLDGASLWAVPAEGVHYDSEVGAIVADGPAPDLAMPDGWTGTRTVAGVWSSDAGDIAVYGSDAVDDGTAVMGAQAAETLGVGSGDTLDFGGTELAVTLDGDDGVLAVPGDLAADVVGDEGWWTLTEPEEMAGRNDLGVVVAAGTGMPSTTNPAVQPETDGDGLIYDAVGGSGATTFEQKFSALFSGQVTSSAFGLISVIGLVLGFVIAISSFLAAVQERRREFGIMASIGLADEVLYFFLVESALVFLSAWLLGITLAGVAVWLVVPQIATPVAWLAASGTVAAYLPAMAIVGALVPVHRLLQQRPVQLLGDTA
jgi:ABC-type antimicrobial peptide transport system permease subunit